MSRRAIPVKFPAAGVVRRQGVHQEGRREPFPAVWSMNTRLEDGLTNRLRGGSFTGISAGTRPSSIVYRDRTLTFSDNAVTASRVGDSTDTSLSSDVSDMMRATLFQFSEADATGEDVVALVPHKDQFLLGFAASETWVQQGDPLSGPRRRVSDQVGIIGADAWCVVHDKVFFLSSRGLYSVGVDGSGLEAISEDVLPEDLIGVTDSTCTLTYQHSDRGVYIHHTGTNWFYDVERKGFWPFDTDTTDSHVLMGPFQLGQAGNYGRVLKLHGTIAIGSANVNWRLVIADTAEEAAANGKSAIEAVIAGSTGFQYVGSRGKWSAGRAHLSYPRDRAAWCCLWLHSEGEWAYESVRLTAKLSGTWR